RPTGRHRDRDLYHGIDAPFRHTPGWQRHGLDFDHAYQRVRNRRYAYGRHADAECQRQQQRHSCPQRPFRERVHDEHRTWGEYGTTGRRSAGYVERRHGAGLESGHDQTNAAFLPVTFANKTHIAINGLGGDDLFVLSVSRPATGWQTLALDGGS